MDAWIVAAQLTLAVLGVLLLGWGAWLRRRGRADAARRLRDRALAALGVLGLAAYLNFGGLHHGRFLHIWDSYHYYVGSKYFPELGYELLYDCTAVADAEAGLRHDVATRTLTDLRTNAQVKTFAILIHPETCLRQFSAARWAEFQHDVGWFRERVDRATWHRMQRDHGYNATPVWNVVGHLLTNLASASELQLAALAALDPLLLVATFLVLAWGFGWRTSALAALMLGTFYPCRFYWTGGAVLRLDWWCCTIAGLCALRRGRPMLGGAALASAALLRLFPAALLLGPALAALAHRRRTRRWHPSHVRLFAGVAVAVAIAVPPALLLAGDGGQRFVANTRKHAETPLTNHMGLPTVLAYRPTSTVRALRERSRDAELWPRFAQARRAALHDTRLLVVAAGVLVLGLLWWQAHLPLWQSAVLASLLIPALLQLTCYYYLFVIAWATLASRRGAGGASAEAADGDAAAAGDATEGAAGADGDADELDPAMGAALLGLCAGSMALALGLSPRVGLDEGYVALSALTLLGLAAITALVVRRGQRGRARLSDATPRTA